MQDKFNRDINYLRVSVTDRCNLRCIYCMPEEGVALAEHDEVLRLEEIAGLVRSAAIVGIKKIRLTGGEALIRKGIVNLIEMINDIPDIEEIALTTNGILLADMAGQLRRAGLDRVNISLDTMNADKYARMTRGGQLSKVWLGIEAALENELFPVKLNVVAIKGFNDQEIVDFAELTQKMPLHVRFIELMPIGAGERMALGGFISSEEVLNQIKQKYNLEPVEDILGAGPAKYYRIPGGQGTIGVISAISNHFCNKCNRVRLTAEGQLRPCLCSPEEIDLKTPLRQGKNEEELADYITKAIKSKPEQHEMQKIGWAQNRRIMTQIGG